MTKIVYSTVYWDQGNRLGFAKKTWDGRMRDIRMMLADLDRPDLQARLKALADSPKRLSQRTLDLMRVMLAGRKLARFEGLLAWHETHEPPPVKPLRRPRHGHATIARARGGRKKNPALDPPDPFDDPAKR